LQGTGTFSLLPFFQNVTRRAGQNCTSSAAGPAIRAAQPADPREEEDADLQKALQVNIHTPKWGMMNAGEPSSMSKDRKQKRLFVHARTDLNSAVT
jgi:hypothetical protein